MYIPELERKTKPNEDRRQITTDSQSQFFASVLQFLQDGQDHEAADLLTKSDLRLLINYELDFLGGSTRAGFIIQIACPRSVYDKLAMLHHQDLPSIPSLVNQAFRSVLGPNEPLSYEVTYSPGPNEFSDLQAQLQESTSNSSPPSMQDSKSHRVQPEENRSSKASMESDSVEHDVSEPFRPSNQEAVDTEREGRIFLCHKSENKELVERYYDVLTKLGFNPWLDKHDMPTGATKHRAIQKAIKSSCAIVFFITEEFSDEGTIAKEIDHAMSQRERREERFAIIGLRFTDDAQVPELIENEIWHDVKDELGSLTAIIDALPIQLGPPNWK